MERRRFLGYAGKSVLAAPLLLPLLWKKRQQDLPEVTPYSAMTAEIWNDLVRRVNELSKDA